MNPSHPEEEDDILPEYDFGNAVRGKYYQAYKAGTNVVFLDPDAGSATASEPRPPGSSYSNP